MEKRLSFLLILKALLMFAVIAFGGIGLGPDEAQYWTWSQELDWGYYSKPPGIAWQIWLGTKLFGNTEWGVRSLVVLMAAAQAFAVYRLARYAGLLEQTALWSALFMAFSPLGIVGSLFAITDVGFLLCWTGACIVVVKALQREQQLNIFYVAFWVMAGALFKWPIYLFWVFILVCRRSLFPSLKLSALLLGVAVSLAGLLPSVWWNASHDWATFRHVFATVQGGSDHRAGGNVLEFLGAQVLLVSPILFIFLLGSIWRWVHERKHLSPPIYFCGLITTASLSFAIALSCFQKIQGNWAIFAYPTAFVLVAWFFFEEGRVKIAWAKVSVGLSLVLAAAVLLFPSLQSIPYRLQPFKHNMGWDNLGEALAKQGYRPGEHFLAGDKYQMASLLSFYGPGQRRAYFLNLHGIRNNQFSYWPSLQEEQKGKVGYFVWVENSPRLEKSIEGKEADYLQELQLAFEKAEAVGLFPLVAEEGKIVKGALIFRCENCKPVKVKNSGLY